MNIYDRIVTKFAYPPAEKMFRRFERKMFSRGISISRIPPAGQRGGGLGTITYGEWCQSIGMFQSLIFANMASDEPKRALDVGCGVGRIFLSYLPYMTDADTYTGIDIDNNFITICKEHFENTNVHFHHVESHNGYYARNSTLERTRWPFNDNSFNILTATSVWTHLTEKDWRFYLNEVGRVLSPGGRAIISFFILDDLYQKALPFKDERLSPYYPQKRSMWIFDRAIEEPGSWFCPKWAAVPEVAVGVSRESFDEAVAESGLSILSYMPGAWKDQPGFHFQDFVVFEKAR